MTIQNLIDIKLTNEEQEHIIDLISLLTMLIAREYSINFNIVNGDASTTYIEDQGSFTISLPETSNENMAVNSIDGKVSFAVVDTKTMFVHELSHIALMLMGCDSELNNARLALAISNVGVANIEAIKTELQKSIVELNPNTSNASFENVFNNNRQYYSEITGTQEGNLYRTGYWTEGDNWTGPYIDSYTEAKINNLDISLIGNEQINILTTGGGHDLLDGGKGSDTMNGGEGNDIYFVDDIGDTIIESSALPTQIDIVNSSITYTLSSNIENLILLGTAVIDATGNELNNVLVGNNAENTLDGKTGNDTMIGGLGNDTYFVDNINDTITED